MDPEFSKEGFISFRGYKVWYGIVGEREKPGKLPLLCLHGGPRAPHDYLEPIGATANTGRRVVFYDQLGSGNSDHPHKPEMWTVKLFMEEVGVVRQALGLKQVHLLGQSRGGMLAMEYALTKPSGLASLIVADSPASMQQWIAETSRLRSELPPPRCKEPYQHTSKLEQPTIPLMKKRRSYFTTATSADSIRGLNASNERMRS